MGSRSFAVSRAVVVAIVFVSLWAWFIPRWMAASKGVVLEPSLNPFAIALMAAGLAVMARCVWDFAWTGHGTPAPWDPPRRLVIHGLYRHTRNPMYLGMGVLIAGEALFLPAIGRELWIMLAVLAIAVNLFILAYEEPTLRRLFGDDYRDYCRNVRRWIPRLTPFDKPSAPAVPSPDLE